jgi:hypothetical protein
VFHDLHSKYALLIAKTPWEWICQVITLKEKFNLRGSAATSESAGASGSGGATPSRGEGRLPSEAKLFRRESAGLPQETALFESHWLPPPKELSPRAVAAPLDGGRRAAIPEPSSLSRRLPSPKSFISGDGSPVIESRPWLYPRTSSK